MGKLLGSLASDEELDRPDLNKCPDCGCYFKQDACPLCGKVCPEEFRAGNRKKVKHKKHKGGSSRVTFVPIYQEWWFIILMMIFMPIVGIILLISAPHKRSHKLIVLVIAALYTIFISYGGISFLFSLFNQPEPPVNADIPKEEYRQTCVYVDPEAFFRDPDAYKDEYVNMTLRIKDSFLSYADDYDAEGSIYYVCTLVDDENGDFTILVRNCILSGQKNFTRGDVVQFFGEGDGEASLYDYSADSVGGEYAGPLLNAAYAEIVPEVDLTETKS